MASGSGRGQLSVQIGAATHANPIIAANQARQFLVGPSVGHEVAAKGQPVARGDVLHGLDDAVANQAQR